MSDKLQLRRDYTLYPQAPRNPLDNYLKEDNHGITLPAERSFDREQGTKSLVKGLMFLNTPKGQICRNNYCDFT